MASENMIRGYEIMAYTEYFIQESWSTYWLGAGTTQESPDLQDLETLTDGSVKIDQATSNECFSLSSTSNKVSFGLSLSYPMRIMGVVFIPQI